jgi:hypothetical protein
MYYYNNHTNNPIDRTESTSSRGTITVNVSNEPIITIEGTADRTSVTYVYEVPKKPEKVKIIKRLTFSFPRVTKVEAPGKDSRQLVINRHAGGYQKYRRRNSWGGRNFCRHEKQ